MPTCYFDWQQLKRVRRLAWSRNQVSILHFVILLPMLIYIDTIQLQKPSKKSAPTIVLEEELIGSLLYHASETVRSLAFSVLVSSSSSIRPLSPVALEHLKAHMSILFSETDAKIRN